MTETKHEYIALVNIGTNPLWVKNTEPTPEQLEQIKDIQTYVQLGQVKIKKATKRTKKEIGE